jgi:CrcB protein
MSLYAWVVAGGIIGSLARWIVALLLPASAGGMPWPTLFANLTGCFVIGFYAALTGPDGRLFVSPRARQFVMTGICGGYTTFSGFSLEVLQLLAGGRLHIAAIYVVLSLTTWLIAVWLGDAIGERINR